VPLALALACQVVKLFFRSIAWQAILRASYPESRLRLRSVFGAYVAGVGVNAVLPARGGDLVKLYLVRHRAPETRYPTLAATLVVETMLDFVVATGLVVWALAIGVLPTHQVYSRLPSVDWRFFLRHERATAIGLGVFLLAVLVGAVVAQHRVERFWARVRLGFAILGDRPRLVRGVLVPQAISWVFRIATVYFFLEAFRVDATLHNALLAQVVDSLATLFPATPGGAGTKQGLIVYLFRGSAISRSLLLAFSVGMNIALTIANLVLGLIAIGLMARTLSFKRLRAASKEDQSEESPV
jgi:glycosyltransferase 2 family protein